MNYYEQKRVELTSSCGDASYIPKVKDAGKLITINDKVQAQIMHNGLKVIADQYYGAFNTKIVESLAGHHEPQEEKVFFEILKHIEPGGVMLELGSYWAYYSLWFAKEVQGGRNYLVEPDLNNLNVGKQNFEINNFSGHFKQAFIGETINEKQSPPIATVDGLIEEYSLENIDILHSDIQGFEYQMLNGANNALKAKMIRFIFISTHSVLVHQQCLNLLRHHDYHILTSHTLPESYSVDGLIVASATLLETQKIPISKRKFRQMNIKEKFRNFLFKIGYFYCWSLVK